MLENKQAIFHNFMEPKRTIGNLIEARSSPRSNLSIHHVKSTPRYC